MLDGSRSVGMLGGGTAAVCRSTVTPGQPWQAQLGHWLTRRSIPYGTAEMGSSYAKAADQQASSAYKQQPARFPMSIDCELPKKVGYVSLLSHRKQNVSTLTDPGPCRVYMRTLNSSGVPDREDTAKGDVT